MNANIIVTELRKHAPFTAVGAASGIVLMYLIVKVGMSRATSELLFWTFHPVHVFMSAMVTAGIYRLHGNKSIPRTLLIGYIGSLGIATVSDSLIPYIGEMLLNLPNRGLHLRIVEKWWLVNPLAFAGIAMAFISPRTQLPHAVHVFLSTWASLFHITMALGADFHWIQLVVVVVFLFLAVWVPCCTSDIIFPLLFSKK